MKAMNSRQTENPSTLQLPFLQPKLCVERRADGSVLLWQSHELVRMPPTLAHLFVERATVFSDRVLIGEPERAGGWRTISYGAMLARAVRIAIGFRARGFVVGDRIVILSGPGIEHAAVMFGAMMAGMVSIALSPTYALAADRARFTHVLARLEPAVVFSTQASEFAAALTEAKAAGAMTLDASDLNRLEHEGNIVSAQALLDGIDANTVYKLLMTSGSTALPKAVIQTHGMACASLAFEASLSTHSKNLRAPHVVLDWLPWSHVGGGITIINNVIHAGASLYLDQGRPVSGQFEATIANLKLFPQEVFATMPIGLSMLADAMDADQNLRTQFFSRLLYVKSGAAAMPAETARRFQDHARAATGRPVPILMGYGTTETHGVLSVTRHSDHANLLGLPKPGVVAKLVPVHDQYELRIKAKSVTPGYFRDESSTQTAFDNEGFFCTRDGVALSDDPLDGLTFTGRMSENFKLATGTWVAAGSLAATLLERLAEDVSDCLVVGEGEHDVRALIWLKPAAEGGSSRIAAGLAALNYESAGSSGRIVAALVSAKPISAEQFERTEKGSLNRSMIMAGRAEEIASLYDRADGSLGGGPTPIYPSSKFERDFKTS